MPYFSQCDSQWGNEQLGGCTDETICSAGCAMSSVAMALKYYGAIVDPSQLNTWLTNNCGYIYRDSNNISHCGGCNIVWGTAANYATGVSVSLIWDNNFQTLRQTLDSGKPVLVRVRNNEHSVVVTGYSGNNPYTYYINDPASRTKTTLADYGNTFSGPMVIYSGPTMPVPSISFTWANNHAISTPGQIVRDRDTNWTFSGTASGNAGVSRVECRIDGNSGRGWSNASGTTSWTYTANGLTGRNKITCRAYDPRDYASAPYILDLHVDTAAPTTSRSFSKQPAHNDWYPPMDVIFTAQDNGSGVGSYIFRADVDKIFYRVNGGAWQTTNGQQAAVNLSTTGIYTIDYYAVDNVGNQEATKSLTAKVDATPPVMPTTATETHGVISGQWQRNISDPAFTWAAATDSGSGVAGYFIEWPTWSGMVQTPAFNPPAVRTGSYPLRVQAVDAAGNRSDFVTLFTFNYDGTAPAAPAIQNLDGVGSGVWQNQVRTPNFAWPTPYDAGSGVVGYYRYWGPDAQGTSDTLVTVNTFASTEPFCTADNACESYLRLRSEDGVGWQSEWATFALRYDGAPPTAMLVANYGQPVVHQTTVHLAVDASDLGSGVAQMRLSNNQTTWSTWLPYTPQLYWEIPAVGRRNHDIYLQVLDHAGNVSGIISTTVHFDVNAPLPKSESFHLWDSLVPAGGGIVTSTTHIQRVTVGQPSETIAMHSTQYLLNPGFQAGALAAPLQVPTATTYTNLGALFASATTTATAIASNNFRLYGSMGQPSHMQTISSTRFVADLGFWAGAARTMTPTPPPPPEPPIPPECEFYSLSINDGALFTRVPQVTLNMCGPDPAQVMVSNDGGFGGATWQPYTEALSWTLTTYGNTIIPRFVYARYKDSQGYIYGNFMDDIIYDPTAPLVVAAFDPLELPADGVTLQTRGAYILQQAARPAYVVNTAQTELFLSASDDSSGLAAMQVSTRADFADAAWEPFAAVVPVSFTEDGTHTLYVRTRDEAGNISTAFGQQVIVDTTPPTIPLTGTLEVLEGVVGPNTMTVTLAISATDVTGGISGTILLPWDQAGSGIGDVRVSLSPAFTDTLWVSYMPLLPTPIRFTGELTPTLYVQLRDLAGNVSTVYTTTYLVDVEPPYGGAEIIAQEGSLATLWLGAEDDLSAVTRVWLSPDYWFFDDVAVVAYQETLEWDMGDSTTLYVRFEDAVGNVSMPTWTWPYEPDYQEHTVYLPLVIRQ
ncbi:MAG: C39 family peptidase [Anaerolineae bacterium]|nr:C39 family peptidase [Anaerolineae bacterium]